MVVWGVLVIVIVRSLAGDASPLLPPPRPAQQQESGAPASAGKQVDGADTGSTSPDSVAAKRRAVRRAALRAERTVPLTHALLASAYDGDRTRALIALARTSRSADDSSIARYDATSLERFTVRIAIGGGLLGRDRLLFRRERAERVRWQRGMGAIVDVTGARTAMPLIPSGGDDIDEEAISLPYVPGRRTLSLGGERGADTTQYTDVDDIVDPLALGAEAYYRYTAGDSEEIRVGGGPAGPQVLRLHEVRLHARRPIWNLGVGSLWFDATSGHLVRAVYRFAAPMNIIAVAKESDPHTFDDVPLWVRPMIMPMTATLSAVTIDYSLHDGRYWMPLSRHADGEARVSAMRLPVRWEVRYRYASINGSDTLPRIPELTTAAAHATPDTARGAGAGGNTLPHSAGPPTLPSPVVEKPGSLASRDAATHAKTGRNGRTELTMRSGAAKTAASDSGRRHTRDVQCASQSDWARVETHDGGAVRVLVRTPCDTLALARSPDLPPSVYGDNDTRFGSQDMAAVLKTLGSDPVPDWAPQPIELRWGPRDGLLRYNRIEGLSPGVAATQTLGLGLTARVEGRFGLADLEPNGEFKLTRTGPLGTISIGGYRRLSSATDWGDPLSFGSSVWNFLVGDDEGFYYRSWGGELSGVETDGVVPYTWRLFTEHEWGASVATHFAVTSALGGAGMLRHNIDARAGTLIGVSFRIRPVWGLDPNGFQASADLRGEGAGGSYAYTRGAADITVAHPVTRFAGAILTVGGGTSAGDVPPQRFWYLGGLRTVRGIAPGAEAGDAYWLTHLEVATKPAFVRPVVFYDLGWAGDRSTWGREGRALSGAGIGASFLDGLVRIDAAKGIWPTHSVRVNAYLQAAF